MQVLVTTLNVHGASPSERWPPTSPPSWPRLRGCTSRRPEHCAASSGTTGIDHSPRCWLVSSGDPEGRSPPNSERSASCSLSESPTQCGPGCSIDDGSNSHPLGTVPCDRRDPALNPEGQALEVAPTSLCEHVASCRPRSPPHTPVVDHQTIASTPSPHLWRCACLVC